MLIKPHPQIIVGLGNPGRNYENTYHNVGYLAVDLLTQKLGAASPKQSSGRHFRSVKFGRLVIAKPTTLMNDSGEAVLEIVKSLKVPPAKILIIHDDSDISLGLYKISFGRNSAGHRGVESIIQSLKTKSFWRLRIGIRPQKEKLVLIKNRKRIRAKAMVLKRLSPDHQKILYSVLNATIEKLIEKEKP